MSVDRRQATEAEAKAIASTVRMRILRLCLDNALTNKQIAQRLEMNPATVLHHVRKLVDTGFLAAQAERSGTRNAREVPYLATGKSWALNVGDSHSSALGQAMIGAFLAEYPPEADPKENYLSRLGVRLTAQERQELTDRIDALLEEYAARRPNGPGEPYSLFVALHPDRR